MTVTPPEVPDGSILQTTKTSLGLAVDYTPFDAELIVHINSVLATLTQLGIGPSGGMSITGYSETWDAFMLRTDELVADPRLNAVKSYMYLRVRMLFDPPSVGYVVTAMEKQIEQLEWRIMVAQDDIINPLPPVITDVTDIFGEDVILDGGG